MNARELMAQRAAKIAEAKTIASAPAMTDEQRTKFDGLMKDAETMKGDIARLSTVEAEDAALEQSNGTRAANTHAIVFNVKGEDLLFLDHANTRLDADAEAAYGRIGLTPGPFPSVGVYAPPRRGDATATPDVSTRTAGVTSFFWTLSEFCEQELLPFLFVDAEDDRQQLPAVALYGGDDHRDL